MDVNTVIDLEWLKSATYADMKSILNASSRHPEMVATLNALLATPEGRVIAYEMINDPDYVPVSRRVLSPEDEVQRALDLKMAEEQEAAAAEVAVVPEPVVEVPVVPVPEPIAEKKKIVVDYQATTEDGTPIGRPTHIEGWSNEEVIEKMKAAHINAVRYAERVKKGRAQSIEAKTQAEQDAQKVNSEQQAADAAVQAAAADKDPAKLADAIKKVSAADRNREIAEQAARNRGKLIADTWLADHTEDFSPVQANINIISEYLKTNKLEFTYDNLDAALTAKRNELAKPVPQAPAQEAPAAAAPNAPAVAPVAPAAAVVAPAAPIAPPAPAAAVTAPVVPVPATPPVSQPAVTAPSTTPAVATNTATAARRPGVNGALQPGTLTAGRPATVQNPQETSTADFRKEVDKMPAKEYRHKLTTSKEFRDKLRAAGIPVLGEDQYRTAR